MPVPLSRSEEVKALTSPSRPADANEEDFWKILIQRIKHGKVIPIVSNSFRLEHIFRGLRQTREAAGCFCTSFGGKFLSVDHMLSQDWAREIGYPMPDGCELARVAQYDRVQQYNRRRVEDDEWAKQHYLDFLKTELLDFAREKHGQTGLFADLDTMLNELSFTELARELNYPQFEGDEEDPLDILARLPLPIYVTTSFHTFIEDALTRNGKQPITQVCFWSGRAAKLDAYREVLENYPPPVNQPLVYHLHGLERYPDTLVISEDDYLDYLAKITHDLDPAHPIIPQALRSDLASSSLIMLGYRLWEWDFRTLFHGIVNAKPQISRILNLIIQLNPDQQYEIHNVDKAKARWYLETYFGPANLKIRWENSETFLCKLRDEWNRRRT